MRPSPLANGRGRYSAADVADEQMSLLRELLQCSPDPGVVVDDAGVVLVANARFCAWLGYDSSQVEGNPVETLVPARFRAAHGAWRRSFHLQPRPREMGAGRDLFVLAADGREMPTEIALSPLDVLDRRLVWVILRDARSHRTTEHRLARLAAIVDSTDDAIIAKTLDGIITDWNAAATRLYGFSAEEAIGRHVSLIIPPDRADEAEQILDLIRSGERVRHFRTLRLHADGHVIPVSLTISPVLDERGELVGASSVVRDLTDELADEGADVFQRGHVQPPVPSLDGSAVPPGVPDTGTVRVLVVDAEAPVRRLVTLLLTGTKWLEIVAEAGDLREAVEQAAATRPDLILLGHGPTQRWTADPRELRDAAPSAQVLVLGEHPPAALGAAGATSRMSLTQTLLTAITQLFEAGPVP